MLFVGLFLLIFLSSTKAVHHVDPYDPVPEDNDADMWRVLYSKLNRLMDESSQLKEIIMDLRQSQNQQINEMQNMLQNAIASNCQPKYLEMRSPQTPEYNRPQAPDYYRPQAADYNRPQAPDYNRPQAPDYNRPQAPDYNRPQAPDYNRPQTPEHNRHPTPEHNSSHTPEHNRRHTPEHNKREWTIILRRMDGSVDFQRNWTDYKHGFGNPDGEFFIGLEKLHTMTTYDGPQELLITLGDWENERRYAKYDLFEIGSEAEQYAMKELGEYSGDAGDALHYHRGMKFSTLDNSNSGHCPQNYGGGWWFNECEDSNLNSAYRKPGELVDLQKVLWSTWKGWDYSLKFAEMKIRSKG
ncbi:angiopoietin-related protein 1 isoform X1 [Stomoxys calcitrans]|uniref:angiopoietin-related protein 1 isoform X1 n=2 Tax=Stomoxys calcitrans TaxID=35570 RepID=UPI0027E39829|nr:angiopoietin-related protein 1 isoform X1 [Stomoxys calcitrans]